MLSEGWDSLEVIKKRKKYKKESLMKEGKRKEKREKKRMGFV